MGGWFNSVVILRLSQPSIAAVEAGAELGKNGYLAKYVLFPNDIIDKQQNAYKVCQFFFVDISV